MDQDPDPDPFLALLLPFFSPPFWLRCNIFAIVTEYSPITQAQVVEIGLQLEERPLFGILRRHVPFTYLAMIIFACFSTCRCWVPFIWFICRIIRATKMYLPKKRKSNFFGLAEELHCNPLTLVVGNQIRFLGWHSVQNNILTL